MSLFIYLLSQEEDDLIKKEIELEKKRLRQPGLTPVRFVKQCYCFFRDDK